MSRKLLFFECCTDVPGTIHDSRVLHNSASYAKAETFKILNFPNGVIENVTIRTLIFGDGGYTLLTWLMRS